MKTHSFKSFAIVLALLVAAAAGAQKKAYLFSYFINNGEDGLHLAYSYDGLKWTALNDEQPYLKPMVGNDRLMRDPSICQAPDGTFHMVWTSSWNNRIIGYASSKDLIHWSEQKAIPVMMHEPTAHNCWAPELFYDAPSKTYYIFWATTIPGRHKEVATSESEKGLNHRIYYVTTKDFKTFSKTQMFFNPDFCVIDAAIAYDPVQKNLMMVVKNENSNPPEKNLRITRTKDIRKGFPTEVSAPITGDYWAEGPSPLFHDGFMYVYFDKYTKHTYGAVRSKDGKHWEDVSETVSFPQGTRHGTAFAVDASVVDNLLRTRYYNPIIADNIADPSLCKFGDTYYLYSTTDMNKGLDMAGMPVVWKSKDFVNWSFDRSPVSGFDWKKAFSYKNDKGEQTKGYFRFWAPGKVVQKDGQYHLFATFVKPNNDARTYSLIADNPEGPFRFAEGDGLLPTENVTNESPCIAPDIDGEPFIDDNGTPYLFWRLRKAAQMTPDMRHLVGNTVTIDTYRKGYSEGPLMFKRNGIYYYVYTLSGNQNYAYAYMMSKESPLSGFTKPEGNDIFLFSAPENGIWGPGHGNVFYNEATDDYIFLYLEYGEGGTTRQVYANRMSFNKDGSIRTLVPDRNGIGYLGVCEETRNNLAFNATFAASSTAEPNNLKVSIETQPNAPLADKGSVKEFERTETYAAASVGDESNRTLWKAENGDINPSIIADLGAVKSVDECQFYFFHPSEGHAWSLKVSVDGKTWTTCAEQKEPKICSPDIAKVGAKVRYLELHINSGEAGLWEWKILAPLLK